MTIEQFERGIIRFQAGIEDDALELKKRVVTLVVRGVVDRTPVDTGHAKGNWQVGIGAPVLGEIDAEDPLGSATLAVARQVIEQIQLGFDVWVTNGVPYARRLEDGHSSQAPQGMVGPTLEEVASQLVALRI